ncbi:hypothetical protein SAMN05421747_11253 [Parapedobacter composti]|uniref:Uncharacterized protein n=1 Tax=Parapedobacter composti TaxID=623281 RepID=A0A1I1JQT4_9SPHI|nr:hypothetical protein SAMN05421747_11253 [Parapedobacter composti]
MVGATEPQILRLVVSVAFIYCPMILFGYFCLLIRYADFEFKQSATA